MHSSRRPFLYRTQYANRHTQPFSPSYTHTEKKTNKFVLLPNAQPINKLNKEQTHIKEHFLLFFRCFRIDNSRTRLSASSSNRYSWLCLLCCMCQAGRSGSSTPLHWPSRKKWRSFYDVRNFPVQVNYFSAGETKYRTASRWNLALAHIQTARRRNRRIAYTSNDNKRWIDNIFNCLQFFGAFFFLFFRMDLWWSYVWPTFARRRLWPENFVLIYLHVQLKWNVKLIFDEYFRHHLPTSTSNPAYTRETFVSQNHFFGCSFRCVFSWISIFYWRPSRGSVLPAKI